MKRTLAIALFVVGCSSGNGAGGGGGDDGPDIDAGTDGAVDAPISLAKPIIFTIVLENKNDESVIGSTNAPYLNSLITKGALATNYKDTNHPSLPNYLHMISGADQYPGVIDVDPTQFPYFPADQPNLGTQLETAGITWRSYQESMGTPCKLTSAGKYAPKHDPFLYFKDMQTGPNGLCAARNVDYSQFEADLASNDYRYMWITPNLDNDGHDPTTDPVTGLRNADLWMSHEVPKILASEGFKANGVLFITWDEDEGANNEKVPMIILSPRLKQVGMTSDADYTHAAYLATIEELLALPRLATVAAKPSMMEFFTP
ncbi:MAG TPA: alkaline phosphatase family protein [Kofleriaceae bacterium]